MNGRILVIDDDEAVRKSFTLALEDSGYQVDTAESGERGIDMQKKDGYDLTFLDLKMPGLSGIETLRELRKVSPDLSIYIVTAFHKEFLSGLQDLKNEGHFFELARKPIGADEIVEIAKAVLPQTINGV